MQTSEPSGREPLILAADQHFYVGGGYAATEDGDVMAGQMYVHGLIPAERTRPVPIVMVHGMGQSGTNYLATPDGREGWAHWFVRAGYAVYVVDQPARGRSAYHPDIDGPTPRGAIATAHGMAQRFTAPARHGTFGRADRHTQWPSDHPHAGAPGDPVYDHFFASQLNAIPTATGRPERLMRAAGAALLDRIGPAILLTHSQSGAMGWQIADARPHLVRGILTVEPGLSPTAELTASQAAPYGIAMAPLTFDPPVEVPNDLGRVEQSAPDAPDLARCWMQAEPARKLPNLAGIPIAIVVAEASPQAHTAHCVARFLRQAGVACDFIRLDEHGIRGNGHMMMLERNSDEIAAFLAGWVAAHQ